MDALGNGAGFWLNFLPRSGGRNRRRPRKPKSTSSSSSDSIPLQSRGNFLADFPLKQAAIASSLTLAGDTIAQLRDRIVAHHRRNADDKEIASAFLLDHDWLRALRMGSYGFLLYGPGTYVWYKFLDNCMPKPTFFNLSAKVILNQIVLGPIVIAVIFAWNNLWLGKLSELPSKYKNDALPTLLYGFRFWIPVTIVNFGVVPLPARVAFMSTCSIFWNFYLSTTMSK